MRDEHAFLQQFTEFPIPMFIEIFRLKLGILRPSGGPVLQLPTA